MTENEKILLAFPVSICKGIMSRTAYTFILTEKRLLFALLNLKMLQAAAKANNEAMPKDKGIFSQVTSAMNSNASFHEKYLHMSIDEILNENKENFFIENNMVSAIKLLDKSYVCFDDTINNDDEIIIKTPSLNYKLRLSNSHISKEYVDIFKSVFGNKVKT